MKESSKPITLQDVLLAEDRAVQVMCTANNRIAMRALDADYWESLRIKTDKTAKDLRAKFNEQTKTVKAG